MSTSDSQRPPGPPRTSGLLQQRLASQPPAAGEPVETPEIPDWRSERFAELAAAEASEYADAKANSKPKDKPEAKRSSPGTSAAPDGVTREGLGNPTSVPPSVVGSSVARASTRAVSGAVDGLAQLGSSVGSSVARTSTRVAHGAGQGLASVSVGTAKVASAGLRGAARASAGAAAGAMRGLLLAFDALGGVTLNALAALGRGARRALSASLRSWLRGGRVFAAFACLAAGVGLFVAARTYAPTSRRVVAAESAQAHETLLGVGTELHRILESLGLAEPIPEAADKPEPPAQLPRYLLEVVTTPEGALVSFAGQELPSPATFELELLPEGPLRVSIAKPGFAPISRRLEARDFTEDGKRLRHALRVTLHPPASHDPERAPAPTAAAPPKDALPPQTIPLPAARPAESAGRTGLFPTEDPRAAPATPF